MIKPKQGSDPLSAGDGDFCADDGKLTGIKGIL